jgi:hypothetical protein
MKCFIFFQDELKRALLFLPAILVTLVKLITPTVAGIFERWEQYPFTTKVAVYSGRLFFARFDYIRVSIKDPNSRIIPLSKNCPRRPVSVHFT